ncbi:MAG: hypothetical protein HQ509_06885 [Candidatus Marinimicrobia bacterium]|nr:hypothetical protein [Candidatus Neomarinimicrobiota bacterium]
MTTLQKFWVFGILKALTLCTMIIVVFREIGSIDGFNTIGADTTYMLSILFPAFTFIVDYLIFTKNDKLDS